MKTRIHTKCLCQNKMALLFVTAFLSCSGIFAQKAKTDSEFIKIKKVHYATVEDLPSIGFTYRLQEDYIENNATQSYEYTGRNSGLLPRNNIYSGLLMNCNDSLQPAKKTLGELATSNQPFFNLDFHFRNVELADQVLKTYTVKEGDKEVTKYYYQINVHLDASLRVDYWANANNKRLLLDSLNHAFTSYRFPQDFNTGAGNYDANLISGYSTAAALQNGFANYFQLVKSNWRDKEMYVWFGNNYKLLNERYLNRVKKESSVYYTDKNKKGGYDDVVRAGNNYVLAMSFMTANAEDKIYANYWTDTIQKTLHESLKIWEARLKEANFDLHSKDALLTDEFVQGMMFNYISGLIYTAQWDKALAQLEFTFKANVKGLIFNEYLKMLKETLLQERSTFLKYHTKYNWVSLKEIK